MILYPAQLTRIVTSGQTPHLLDSGIYTTRHQIMDSQCFFSGPLRKFSSLSFSHLSPHKSNLQLPKLHFQNKTLIMDIMQTQIGYNANIDQKCYKLELCMLSYHVNCDQEKVLAKIIHVPGLTAVPYMYTYAIRTQYRSVQGLGGGKVSGTQSPPPTAFCKVKIINLIHKKQQRTTNFTVCSLDCRRESHLSERDSLRTSFN